MEKVEPKSTCLDVFKGLWAYTLTTGCIGFPVAFSTYVYSQSLLVVAKVFPEAAGILCADS